MRAAAGTVSVTAVIGVRIDTLASDFTLRRAARAAPAAATTPASASPAATRSGSAVGQAARCTEPSRHHDQTSSVANGSTGAKRRRSVSSAMPSAARAEAAPSASSSAA